MTAAQGTERFGTKEPDYDKLKSIDWTFRDAHTRGGPHGIHPYPAKFIPQIPRSLILDLHPGDGTAVLDPFCGSGTTLVEAALAGIPAIGIDLHPLACLISKVKVTPLQSSLVTAADAAVKRATHHAPHPPPIPGLDHWFHPDIQLALAALLDAIDEEEDIDVRDALRIALSSIIVRVSRQDGETRYAAVEKGCNSSDVVAGFVQAARRIELALSTTWTRPFAQGSVQIINRDILAVKAGHISQRVSLVVTSPPYPNAYEYWLYHKYRMYWLGMDPVEVRKKEIGARPHYFKANPQTPLDFERQMEAVFNLLREVVVPFGHVCFQVGTSMIRGTVLDNAELLERVAVRTGFTLALVLLRDIPRSRKAFNLSHARINQEKILVLRRGDS